MKRKFSIVFCLLVLAVGFGSLLNVHTNAQSQDDFTTNVLNHGVPFDHADCCGEVGPNDPPIPASHFEPGFVSLSGNDARLEINGMKAILEPSTPAVIPEATLANHIAVLNQVRQVLIDSKLAVAPE